MRYHVPLALTLLLLTSGCGQKAAPPAAAPAPSAAPTQSQPKTPPPAPAATPSSGRTIHIAPGPDVQTTLQEALILAKPGTTIQLAAGTYEFELGLSLDVDKVTLRGEGMEKTILDFKKQTAGSEGLFVTSDHVLLEDFTIQDTKGNAMKSQGADNIIIRRVRGQWTGGPKETNGAYGLYPVSSTNVLVEDCVAIGASDAGIYVGQSKNVIVRNCRAEFNVAGIEIENCHVADVYGCTATNNTGGILAFDLPDLPQQRGRDIRILNNKVFDNNTPNFAPKGNIVANVPAGTGIMIMANSNVEIFENEIRDHGTCNVMIVSYQSTRIPIKDPNYYPYAEGVHIHHNVFGRAGYSPGGELGAGLALLVGSPIPDIIWDGIVNEAKLVDGQVPPESRIYIRDNQKTDGELTFASMGGLATLQNPLEAQVKRDLGEHAGSLPSLPPVKIPGIE